MALEIDMLDADVVGLDERPVNSSGRLVGIEERRLFIDFLPVVGCPAPECRTPLRA